MQRKPAGRPPNRDLAAARLLGDKTYPGKRCRKCGGIERYTKGGACVRCMRAYAVEARQVYRAAKRIDLDLDFLDTHVSQGVTHATRVEASDEDLDFLGEAPLSQGVTDDPISSREKLNILIPGATETRVTACDSNSDPEPQANSDPEPLCPQCGCGVEADHESIGGWLRRVSPWRCTICDWEDVNPPPTIA